MAFSSADIEQEASRLYAKLGKLGWSFDSCQAYAPLTLEINQLKKQKNAIILAHSYQTPDIIYGVADFVGDSYALSSHASKTSASIIVFAGVKFMAETAKLLNPSKKVFLPSMDAGCSLADGITAEDVKKLKAQFPNTPVICYINTSAEVKAECDICCTSANAAKIISSFPQDSLIFIPDEFMAKNLSLQTGKKLIGWTAKCIVHQDFNKDTIKSIKSLFPSVKILAHSECSPQVAQLADAVGGTSDMERFVRGSSASSFMLITECGLSDRLRAEFPDKQFIGACSLCPYMKKISLKNILHVLLHEPKENEISIPPEVAIKARKAIQKMLDIS
ncbi:MAG: quinolinate synthase NadA [Candidatus Micrarchaeota archaeon]|nr:quinolinate synthase NadA [Candidatus Micrarchaeota archaeon]